MPIYITEYVSLDWLGVGRWALPGVSLLYVPSAHYSLYSLYLQFLTGITAE